MEGIGKSTGKCTDNDVSCSSIGPEYVFEKSASPSAAGVSIPTTIVSMKDAGAATSQTRLSASKEEGVQMVLDEDEERLFEVLVAAAAAFESGEIALEENEDKKTEDGQRQGKPGARALEVRVAGGWVRDKLLGLQTHDVDIAVNNLTGVQFATLVQSYLRKVESCAGEDGDNGKRIRSGDGVERRRSQAGKLAVIAANPEQSKHLETATMKVCGIDVDFCNLRAQEIYQHDSRIPIVKLGTPLEDALRRDFTVNALFYHLQTRSVEDWTGSGIRDLIEGNIVTPLEPVQTFRDDPLRVLRAIRFAVRYKFALDPALEDACRNVEIHKALHRKVSRERVGKELEGMLSGKGANPVWALTTIGRLRLAGSVFCIPRVGLDKVAAISGHILGHPYPTTMIDNLQEDTHEVRHAREIGWEEALTLLSILPRVLEAHEKVFAEVTSADHRKESQKTTVDSRLLPIAVYLLPFRTLVYEEEKKQNNDAKRKQWIVAHFILRQSMKFKNKDVSSMAVLQETVDRMSNFLSKIASPENMENMENMRSNICRLDAGMLLRTTKDQWVSTLLLATVLKIRQQQRGEDGDFSQKKVDWIEVSKIVYRAIVDLDLDGCWKMKPLMDGKAVIKALDLPHGPLVGTYLNEQVRWMLLNPNGSREECEEHLKSVKRKLEESAAEQNATNIGKSDGTGTTPSSSVNAGLEKTSEHFSKKMHVAGVDETRRGEEI